MWTKAQETRLNEIEVELKRMTGYKAAQLSDRQVKHMSQLVDEGEALLVQRNTYRKAISMGDHASPNPYGGPAEAPSGAGIPTKKSFAGLGHSEPKWTPPSPLTASAEQYKTLFDAARNRVPGYQFEVGTKGVGDWGIGTKSAITEGGLSGGGLTGLPPVMLPTLTMPLPYEPDRLFEHFNGIAMDGPAVAFLQHTANASPAAVVAEGATKPDLGMTFVEQVVRPTKIAAIASVTMEALQDFEAFISWVPHELNRAVINAETDAVVNGNVSGGPTGMNGILAASGLLSRPIGSDTPLDAIQLAFNDLRTGPAFGTADLVALSPTTWNTLRRQKSSFGTYLLSPDPSTGQVESIWGVKVVQNTMIPDGKALVFDTTQAVLAWTRMAMTIQVNYYGDTEWTQNLISFRAEERIAIGVRRPSAVCVVTGLPTS
jgi:capsid protein